jgi:hypothetical protein
LDSRSWRTHCGARSITARMVEVSKVVIACL